MPFRRPTSRQRQWTLRSGVPNLFFHVVRRHRRAGPWWPPPRWRNRTSRSLRRNHPTPEVSPCQRSDSRRHSECPRSVRGRSQQKATRLAPLPTPLPPAPVLRWRSFKQLPFRSPSIDPGPWSFWGFASLPACQPPVTDVETMVNMFVGLVDWSRTHSTLRARCPPAPGSSIRKVMWWAITPFGVRWKPQRPERSARSSSSKSGTTAGS
ncbi:MAG: hypothetical protein ACJAR2_002395 [Ilumatobacter sp.]|jgi:hypothetical protein